jgi:hypothetical protein
MYRTGFRVVLAAASVSLALVACTPSGGADIPQSVPFPLAIGEGARLGEWTVWRTDAEGVLVVHGDSGLAVEVRAASNGWFRYANGSAQWIVWSTGEQSEQGLEANPAEYAQRKVGGALPLGAGVLSSWAFVSDGRTLRFVCTASGETIEIDGEGDTFRYKTFDAKEVTFPQ